MKGLYFLALSYPLPATAAHSEVGSRLTDNTEFNTGSKRSQTGSPVKLADLCQYSTLLGADSLSQSDLEIIDPKNGAGGKDIIDLDYNEYFWNEIIVLRVANCQRHKSKIQAATHDIAAFAVPKIFHADTIVDHSAFRNEQAEVSALNPLSTI